MLTDDNDAKNVRYRRKYFQRDKKVETESDLCTRLALREVVNCDQH